MISLNGTFFVQIIHFFFTYIVLRRFLFYPLVSIVQHDQAKITAIQEHITQKKYEIVQKKKMRSELWKELRIAIHKNSFNTYKTLKETKNEPLLQNKNEVVSFSTSSLKNIILNAVVKDITNN